MRFTLRLLCMFICMFTIPFVCVTSAASKSGLRGVVTDSEGAAIKGVSIRVRWDQSGNRVGLKTNFGIEKDLEVTTNVSGEFTVELPPGFYDIFVSADAFSPECRKVRIKPGEIVVYKTRLRADDLVTQELGDEF